MQVSAVRRASRMKVVNVSPHADRVPLGIDLDGDFRSPDKLAPAMMPAINKYRNESYRATRQKPRY